MIPLWGITGLFSDTSAWSQEIDYPQLWKDSWQKAEAILQDNRPFMKREASRMDIPLDEAVAVIFPELVRYSAIRDALEISLLKTLYVYKGDDYADFSVGIFQLKPSCAVQIRQKAIFMKDPLVKMPKLTTNIPDVKWNMLNGDDIKASVKYDEFCIVLGSQIKDINGNTILTLKDNVDFNGDNLWISSDNKRYAWFEYGTLYFSDGKELNEVAEVGLQKDGNGTCLSYFYYSPAEDAIKMCKIAF